MEKNEVEVHLRDHQKLIEQLQGQLLATASLLKMYVHRAPGFAPISEDQFWELDDSFLNVALPDAAIHAAQVWIRLLLKQNP